LVPSTELAGALVRVKRERGSRSSVATDVVNKGVRCFFAEKLRTVPDPPPPDVPGQWYPFAQARIETYNAAGGGIERQRS